MGFEHDGNGGYPGVEGGELEGRRNTLVQAQSGTAKVLRRDR